MRRNRLRLILVSMLLLSGPRSEAADPKTAARVTQAALRAVGKMGDLACPECAEAKTAEFRKALCAGARAYPRKADEILAFQSTRNYSGFGAENPYCQAIWANANGALDDPLARRALHNKCDQAGSVQVSDPKWKDAEVKLRARGYRALVEIQASAQQPNASAASRSEAQRAEHAREQLVQRVASIRNSVKAACCGQDTNCQWTVGEMAIEFCDPKSGFPCHLSRYDPPDSKLYWGELHDLFPEKFRPPIVTGPFPGTQATIRDALVKNGLLNGKTGMPYAGRVVLSPFLRFDAQGQAVWNLEAEGEGVLRHEILHGCDAIRTQILARFGSAAKPGKDVDAALGVAHFHNRSSTVACRLDEPTKRRYRELLRLYGEPDELAGCFESAVNAGISHYPSGLCEYKEWHVMDRWDGACPRAQLQEAFARYLELASAPKGHGNRFDRLACFGSLDNLHPMGADVLECVLQFSGRLRPAIQDDACGPP